MAEITCSSCGKKFNVPDGKTKAFCGYCGAMTEIKEPASPAEESPAAVPETAPEVNPEPVPEVKDEPAQEPAPEEETKSAADYEPHNEPAPVSEPAPEVTPEPEAEEETKSAFDFQQGTDTILPESGVFQQNPAFTGSVPQQPSFVNTPIPSAPQQEPAKKKSKTGIIIAAVVLVLAIAAAAVYYFVLMPVYITSIKIDTADVDSDRDAIVLNVGDTYDIEYTAAPENNRHDDLTWVSSSDKIATVEGGKVTAVSEGECSILVTSEKGTKAEIKFYVVVSVEEITLSKTAIEIEAGNTSVLSVSYTPENATDKHCTWESSDESVATIKDGLITAVDEGECTITVTSVDGPTAECAVTVTKPKPESFIVGTWNGIYGADSDTGASSALNEGAVSIVINSNGTATYTISDESFELTWKYYKTTDDGDYVYDFYLNGSEVMIGEYFVSGESAGYMGLAGESLTVIYERSTSQA